MDASPPPSQDARLDELEIRLAFFEDLIDTLNGLVARQGEQIEALGRELLRLRERGDAWSAGRNGSTTVGDDQSGPVDERPPHY